VTAADNQMQNMDYEKEIRELKRRADLTETKLSQQAGQFEFISGQLRDIQLYMHARFSDLDDKISEMDRRLTSADKKIDTIDRKLDGLDRKVDALPRVIAELIGQRG
jgi:chromosome segregation ATPase